MSTPPWYLMNGSNDYYSGFESDEFGQVSVNRFNELLMVSPEAYNVLINDIESRVIIQNRKELNNEKRVLSKIGEIDTGYIITYKEEPWMIVTEVDDNRIYQYGTMQRCNQTLRFQLSDTTIYSYPCIVSNKTTYRDGVEYDKHMTLATGQLNITVVADDVTSEIKVDKRFIFGLEAWRVIFIDSLSVPGISFITIEKDELQPQDSLELGIADYLLVDGTEDGKQDELDDSSAYTITIGGANTIKRNQTSSYVVEVSSLGDNVDELVVYSIYGEDKESNTSLAKIISQDGEKCTIQNNNCSEGVVWLKATLQKDESVETWMRIEMIPLW